MNKKTTANSYKITDLTKIGVIEPSSLEEDSFLICSHCETSMIRFGGKNQYVCKKCGLVKELEDAADTATTATLNKKKEQIGPKIAKRKGNEGVFFKNIKFTQTHPAYRPKSKLQELFDAEDEAEENRLKAQGCLIGTEQCQGYYQTDWPRRPTQAINLINYI